MTARELFVGSALVMLRWFGVVGLVVVTWFAAGSYHREQYRKDAIEAMETRVRAECLRPGWVRTRDDAREYDLVNSEVDLLTRRMELLTRRTNSMLDTAAEMEDFRTTVGVPGQAPLPYGVGGVGGSVPNQKIRKDGGR